MAVIGLVYSKLTIAYNEYRSWVENMQKNVTLNVGLFQIFSATWLKKKQVRIQYQFMQ